MNPEVDRLVAKLARLPHVVSISLGGSRALGSADQHSDWDLGLYYEDGFQPEPILCIEGCVKATALGAWGMILDGGAIINAGQHTVDIAYRRVSLLDAILKSTRVGEFTVETAPSYIAGLPSYVLAAELYHNRVLVGPGVPPIDYPEKLSINAYDYWSSAANFLQRYLQTLIARNSPLIAGHLIKLALSCAHAISAYNKSWVTNEKHLLEKTGLAEAISNALAMRLDPRAAVDSLIASLLEGEPANDAQSRSSRIPTSAGPA